ncbi:MAG: NUDIX domain-containing protein [Alphaproteobacteria bacterium]|nr:NUDIX domain-containing protein [Alphaproteobacteria bacterium]
MKLKQHLYPVLDAYADMFGETEGVVAFRLFLAAHDELSDRKKNLAGHLTGSTIVWHRPTDSVLRVYHTKLNRWVFSSGGHVDPGELPWQAASRELREELGFDAAPLYDPALPVPLIFDAHPIPASARKGEPPHWHYDMVYLYGVDEKPVIDADPGEVSRFEWVGVGDVTRGNSPVDLREQMLRYGAGDAFSLNRWRSGGPSRARAASS